MIIGEIILSQTSRLAFAETPVVHRIPFSSVARLEEVYHDLSELLAKAARKANDLPVALEVDGHCGAKVTIPTAELYSVAMNDYAKMNAETPGQETAFPYLKFGKH